jgi:sterol desaturase/sphingolipid hydroxylase (fatty acid hydroxylase superfamily)
MEAKYLIILLSNVLRYFIFAGIPFLIFYMLFKNSFVANKIQARFADKKDFIREIFYSLQTTLILATVAFLILHSPLGAYTQVYSDMSTYPLWWIPVSVLLALVIHDSYFYWLHRTIHKPKLYKRVHLVHHKSIMPSPWASYSFHFFEGVLEAMAGPLVLLLIPMHPLSFFLFTLVSFLINIYGHLGYEIAPKWFRNSFLFQILNSSVHHNLHHEKVNANYGLYFRIWDRVMKTEHPDYVKRYDLIQERRFGTQAEVKTSNA